MTDNPRYDKHDDPAIRGREIDFRILPHYRLWESCDHVTLCRETHEQAVNGACPTHGGDGCLHAYVQVSALHRLEARWAETAWGR